MFRRLREWLNPNDVIKSIVMVATGDGHWKGEDDPLIRICGRVFSLYFPLRPGAKKFKATCYKKPRKGAVRVAKINSPLWSILSSDDKHKHEVLIGISRWLPKKSFILVEEVLDA